MSAKEIIEVIDKMTHEEMCNIWRFSESGNRYLEGIVGDYFQDRLFNHFGGFTPEISKKIGINKE